MLRKILRFILSEQVYSHLRKWRVLFLRLKAQALTNISFITYDFLNAIYAAYCKLNYKLRHVNHQSYYSKKLDLKLRTQLSEILDRTTKSQPLLLGRVPGHQSCDLIELVKGMEKFPLRFKRNFIYGPSPLQTLIRTAPFAHIESELGACPFYYNLQLLRIQKNKENKFQISGLDHITQGSHVGLKGFLVLGLTEMTYDISAQLKDRNTARFRKKTGDFIRITAPIIEMEFCSEGVIDSVDLLYIHALPSLNLIPICQQPGWDSIRPNLLWKSQIESVPQIEVPNKDELLNKISKGSFSGLNLGGGPHVYPRWVNIDTRYGIESTENLLPLWLERSEQLPVQSNSMDYVFSSHFFEHVDDELMDALLLEARRILRPGGVMVVLVPHFEKALECYRAGSWSFVDGWTFLERAERFSINNLELNLETLTASMFCGSSHISARKGPGSRWSYDGAPAIPKDQLRESLLKKSPKEVSNFLNAHLNDPDLTEHVNAFTEQDLRARIEKIGFESVPMNDSRVQKLKASMIGYKNNWASITLELAFVKPLNKKSEQGLPTISP